MKRYILLLLVIPSVFGCNGRTAPDVAFESLSEAGKKVSLKDFRGKVVLIDFWATWCRPCLQSMPDIQAFHSKYSAKGLEIIAVSNESRFEVTRFARSSPFTYPIYLDVDGKANAAFAVTEIPRTIILDKNGAIAFDGHPAETAEIDKLLSSLLE